VRSNFPQKKVFLDTCIFIYFLENNKDFGQPAKNIFEQVEEGLIEAEMSVLTMTELLTGPYRTKNDLMALEYHALLYYFPNLHIIDINLDIAVEAARIRSDYDFSVPDSLLLASALHTGADAFITNDQKLFQFPELKMVELNQL
jgi:predicted nucleic acid-binding protein